MPYIKPLTCVVHGLNYCTFLLVDIQNGYRCSKGEGRVGQVRSGRSYTVMAISLLFFLVYEVLFSPLAKKKKSQSFSFLNRNIHKHKGVCLFFYWLYYNMTVIPPWHDNTQSRPPTCHSKKKKRYTFYLCFLSFFFLQGAKYSLMI